LGDRPTAYMWVLLPRPLERCRWPERGARWGPSVRNAWTAGDGFVRSDQIRPLLASRARRRSLAVHAFGTRRRRRRQTDLRRWSGFGRWPGPTAL